MWNVDASKYRGVFVYAIIESRNYYKVKRTRQGRGWHGKWSINGLAQADDEPELKGWNIFGAEGLIDEPFLDIETFPTLGAVEQYIDFRLEEIKYHG